MMMSNRHFFKFERKTAAQKEEVQTYNKDLINRTNLTKASLVYSFGSLISENVTQ
jgi:hypothetical protein